MDGIDKLANKGVFRFGEKSAISETKKTIIVVGIARGGTSLVAGALHHLGVYLGKKSSAPVFEDVFLAGAIESGDYEKAQSIIDEYSEAEDTWAFKRPASIEYLEYLDSVCHNPVYLIVFKDIFSVANRNSISMKSDVLLGLRDAQSGYDKIIEFTQKKGVSGVLFSYEKIISDKSAFIDYLVQVVGSERVSSIQINNAIKFIEPNSAAYLDSTRITKSKGVVDKITPTKVAGWAMSVHSSKSVEVELYINGVFHSRTLADAYREDLKDKGLHPDGKAGYVFKLDPNILGDSDEVSVIVSGDIRYLNSSAVNN